MMSLINSCSLLSLSSAIVKLVVAAKIRLPAPPIISRDRDHPRGVNQCEFFGHGTTADPSSRAHVHPTRPQPAGTRYTRLAVPGRMLGRVLRRGRTPSKAVDHSCTGTRG